MFPRPPSGKIKEKRVSEFDYDLFVTGAGSGGVRAARTAAAAGIRVAVAEDRYLGGTCVNVGCVPKKLYSYAAQFQDAFADSRGFGRSEERRVGKECGSVGEANGVRVKSAR